TPDMQKATLASRLLYVTKLTRRLRLACFLVTHHYRAGIESLGIRIAVDELDERHRRVVAMAEPRLQHAGITARAARIAWSYYVEQLLHLIGIADLGQRLAAGMKIGASAARQRHELLHHRTKGLRLGQCGLDLLVLDQRRHHVREHRGTMGRRHIELTAGITMAHGTLP